MMRVLWKTHSYQFLAQCLVQLRLDRDRSPGHLLALPPPCSQGFGGDCDAMTLWGVVCVKLTPTFVVSSSTTGIMLVVKFVVAASGLVRSVI